MSEHDERIVWQVEERQPQRPLIEVHGPDVVRIEASLEPGAEDNVTTDLMCTASCWCNKHGGGGADAGKGVGKKVPPGSMGA